MISASRRYCDVCNVRIFAREPYHVGTAPAAAAEEFRANPTNAPNFTPLADGSVMIELCERCVDEAPDLVEVMQLRSADV